VKSDSEYFETIRDIYAAVSGSALTGELTESLLLRDVGVSSLMAITLISQHLEDRGQDPSDIEMEWLELIDTFGGVIGILRSIDSMVDSAAA
jgi:acyl carrier protein